VTVERNLLISLLKLTKKSSALFEDVKKEAHLPMDLCFELLQKMQNENLVYLKNDTIEIKSSNRLKLAIKAASLGSDIQNVSDLLCWQEFEEITALAMRSNGYSVHNNVRFKQGGRRWEIDVIGCKKPLVVCIDCKRWQHIINASALKRIVMSQVDRTGALADFLPNPALKLECDKWEKAKFIPAVVSLFQSAYKFCYEVPIVPVLQMQDFICQLPAYIHEIKFVPKTFEKLSHDL
jgi:Holliday junction resolvase-like predicted endonuclease